MKLELSASNGKSYIEDKRVGFEGFGKNGDQVEVIFTNSFGEKLVYTIKVSRKCRLVMN